MGQIDEMRRRVHVNQEWATVHYSQNLNVTLGPEPRYVNSTPIKLTGAVRNIYGHLYNRPFVHDVNEAVIPITRQ